MKIIITIQIIIINIYINLLFTTDSLKKVILIGESYSRFFQAKHGSNAVLDKGGRIPSSPQMSSFPQHSRTQWMNALLFTTATKALKNLGIKNYFLHSRLVILLNVYLKKQWHDVEQKIFITIKARADAEHMESLLLFDSLKEVTTCNLLKNISGTWNNDKPKGMPRTISRLVVVAPSSKTQSTSTLLMLRSLRHLP